MRCRTDVSVSPRDNGTHRWTLGQFVSRYQLDVEVFALGFPPGLHQPLEDLDGHKDNSTISYWSET
ncbi:hypothetical protein CRUP_002940 [Coryphaenoides rupestris]|nr:hypothetical protein CRUP_002940 [Coryphaenoides rupestris]